MKLLPLALLLLTPVATAKTWLVDNGFVPSGDFTSIQAAIDAAASGDTIVVNGGVYQENLVIQGKGLTLHGKGVTLQYLPGSGSAPVLTVEDLTAEQRVSIEDFTIFRITGEWGPAIVLEDNAGRVRLQNIFVDSYDGDALIATACSDLLLVDCLFQSNLPQKDSAGIARPSVGMTLRDGTVAWAWETSVRGSHGFPLFSDPVDLLPGGDAVLVDDSTLHVVHPDFRGGTGNSVDQAGCLNAGPGGAGLRILSSTGGTPLVEVQNGFVKAGSAGAFDACAQDPGMTADVEGLAGAYGNLYFGHGRLLLMDGHPSPLGQLGVRIQGAPQDIYIIFGAGQSSSPTPLAGFLGPVCIDPGSAKVLRVGGLGVNGLDDFNVDLSSTPPFAIQLQAALFAQDLSRWLTNPIALRNS